MQPLKITAYPRVGIESDAFLPIDGILYFAAMRREYGHQLLTTPGEVADVAPIPLPLARLGRGSEWYYAASFACWDAPAEYSAFWVKRPDVEYERLIDFGGRRGRIETAKGQYKAYHMQTFLRHAIAVSWFVVGDRDEIETLLRPMLHIGKKTAQGNGRLVGWQVEVWPHDWSVYDGDGRLMRSIPTEGGVLYGIRPPYWLPENQTPAALPAF